MWPGIVNLTPKNCNYTLLTVRKDGTPVIKERTILNPSYCGNNGYNDIEGDYNYWIPEGFLSAVMEKNSAMSNLLVFPSSKYYSFINAFDFLNTNTTSVTVAFSLRKFHFIFKFDTNNI